MWRVKMLGGTKHIYDFQSFKSNYRTVQYEATDRYKIERLLENE